MKRVTFELALQLKGVVEHLSWSGYQTSVPGLVVCRVPWKDADGWEPGDVWQIVHELSGWVIGKYRIRTRALAVIAAEAFGKLADWTVPIEALAGDEALRLATRAALRGVGL